MLGPIRATRNQHRLGTHGINLTEAGLGNPSSVLGVIFFVFMGNMDLIFQNLFTKWSLNKSRKEAYPALPFILQDHPMKSHLTDKETGV